MMRCGVTTICAPAIPINRPAWPSRCCRPTTSVTRRIAQFLGRGIAVVWLVDPEGRSVSVYRPSQLPQVFEGDDELTGDPELPDFRCRVADLFYLPGEEAPAGPAGQG
jgi:hypothetical protein